MRKVLALVAGLAGGAGASQAPEFTQQYLQRLAGQVDALAVVVADFDASAAKAGLTRVQALEELQGSAFLDSRRDDMIRTFGRYAGLSADLVALRQASVMERLTMPWRFTDAATINATWADFRPGVQLTFEGAVAGGAGFAAGWLALQAVLSALFWPFRRWRREPAG